MGMDGTGYSSLNGKEVLTQNIEFVKQCNRITVDDPTNVGDMVYTKIKPRRK